MTKNFRETLHFQIKPSKRIETVFDALHILAVLACWLNTLDPIYRLMLTGAVIGIWCLKKSRRQAIPVHLSYTSAHGWEISYDGSNYLTATILETTVVTDMAVFLHYATNHGRNRNLMIPKDSLPKNDFRHLIVTLKLSECSRH